MQKKVFDQINMKNIHSPNIENWNANIEMVFRNSK